MAIEVDCIIPVYNEKNISLLIKEIESASNNKYDFFLTIVDDGSDIPVERSINPNNRIQIIRHNTNLGNGASIKTGIFATQRELVLLMDGDEQHNPVYMENLVDSLDKYDLVIGSREQWINCSIFRGWANGFYCCLAGWLLGQYIPDITSGFRAFKRSIFHKVFPAFPNKFSSPITLVLFAYLMNKSVGYYPIVVRKRYGKSKIKMFQDGIRFLHCILKIGILANPVKFFYTLAVFLVTIGVTYTALTSLKIGRLFIPGGATITFILAGLALVAAHVVDFARIILILILHSEKS